jgi:hypothetical protein
MQLKTNRQSFDTPAVNEPFYFIRVLFVQVSKMFFEEEEDCEDCDCEGCEDEE